MNTEYSNFKNHFHTTTWTDEEISRGIVWAASNESPIISNHPEIPYKYLTSHGKVGPIQPCKIIGEALNYEAARLITATGTDRNIMVYDCDESRGRPTKRLMALIRTTFNKYQKPRTPNNLTDIYMRKPVRFEEPLDSPFFGMNINFVPDELWNNIEYFYQYELGGTFPKDRRHLVVGVANSDAFQLAICPTTKKVCMAVLDYNNVILGAY